MTDFLVTTRGVAFKPRLFNISCRKVGGLRFLKLGRLTIMVCLSKAYRPL